MTKWEIKATINPENSNGNATIMEQKGIRKPTVGKRKKMRTNVQRIGNKRICRMRSMQAVWNSCWLASITKIALFLISVAD